MKKREELPLKHIEEPEKFDGGCESEVFKFKPEKGKEYVYKEVHDALGYKKRPLEEMAYAMKKVYDFIKKYYGDMVVDTHFIVAKNKKGIPCAMKVQEKIKGARLWDLGSDDYRHDKAWEQVKKIKENLSKVKYEIAEDLSLKNYLENDPGYLVGDINNPSNIIVDKKGDIKIIDW